MQRPAAARDASAGSPKKNNAPSPSSPGFNVTWKTAVIFMVVILIPWAVYVNFHPTLHLSSLSKEHSTSQANYVTTSVIHQLGQKQSETTATTPATPDTTTTTTTSSSTVTSPVTSSVVPVSSSGLSFPQLPVQGPVPTNGAKPLWGVKHKGTDAIFALACNYPKVYYQRFVGSLRKFGYLEDVVLAVSPEVKMKPGVSDYLQKTGVVAYGFEVDCEGVDNCRLRDEFLGYPDPRPFRTFANIRYALYEYWLRQYEPHSLILILDFRDTFFQAHPFASFGSFASRQQQSPRYELHMYAENFEVKNIGICVFNSNWIKTCFGKEALVALKEKPVICSGSTLGSYPAVHHYVRTMLQSMDTVKCWLKGIESDQGYQNFLFYNGHFNTALGNATLYMQGQGVVNTIGAMNGFRVPKEKKGPLGTRWKARDSDGYVINKDGSRSACVHQWDRWYDELVNFIDTNLYEK